MALERKDPARPVILCAGSLHHDVIVAAPALPRPDQTMVGTAVRYAFGGKGGNQAVAAARAGAEAHMAGAVGSDPAAGVLRAKLAAAGVGQGQLQSHPGASGMSVAISLPDGSYGAVIVSAANLAFDPDRVHFPDRCSCLVLQNEVPEAVNLALSRRARKAGIRTVLNAAPARPVDPALLRLVDLLVVNRGEAADLLGRAEAGLDAPCAAHDLRALGPPAVIITLGGEGLVLAEGDATLAELAHPVDVVSTHGAGDAFIGGLASEWARGGSLAAAAAFGQAAAALHVSLAHDRHDTITEAAIRARLRNR